MNIEEPVICWHKRRSSAATLAPHLTVLEKRIDLHIALILYKACLFKRFEDFHF